MIKPTIGRVVLFYPGSEDFIGAVHPKNGTIEPLPALICRVHSDTEINVGGFDALGRPFAATHVPLMQGDGPFGDRHASLSYAAWMPYQKAVAAGTTMPVHHKGITP